MKKSDANEWVSRSGNIVRVGITNDARKELGDIVFVELPQLGKILEKGEEAAVLESTKAAADSYAPLKGKVSKVNQNLIDNPSLVAQDPHGEGWLYEMEIDDLTSFENLPNL